MKCERFGNAYESNGYDSWMTFLAKYDLFCICNGQPRHISMQIEAFLNKIARIEGTLGNPFSEEKCEELCEIFSAMLDESYKI